ncbi:MAG TPA: DUF3592 domain-containing protein [Ferruginibacter sp.]|nr:DUF3592 domain-containing protein [Ferruginibacter sp.]
MIAAYILLVLFGFLPFLIVLYKMKKVQRMKKNGIKTTGIVRGISGSPTAKLSRIVIDYLSEDTNQYIRKELTVAGMPYAVGQELPLYYDKKDPYKMVFDSGKGFIPMIIFTLLIAAFAIAACFLINKSILNGEM